ncbi:uncharacterized protein LOC133896967 [Phragmites australis]|uniref:uncharacterized protein LOC133896967 n=1 Tax=Phragmites australis TaxID=29695 RepID=UPI002D77BAF2|nr:uncharacterized protein LOC133896967 [Phragmites australis]
MELELFWILTEELPAPSGEDVQDEIERTCLNALVARWEKANGSALACLLAALSNRLFDVYMGFEEAQKVWSELNDKYAKNDNDNEPFMVASYLNFCIGDDRLVMEQIHELQLILRDLGQYGGVLLENFLVNAILAKLPTSWCDFVTEKSKAGYSGVKASTQANLVEHKNQPKRNVKKEKSKPRFLGPKANAMKKKKKPEIVCYVCGGLNCCDPFMANSPGADGRSILMENGVSTAVHEVGQVSIKLTSG